MASKNRIKRLQSRARKAASKAAGMANPGGKSRYQRKVAAKRGRGPVRSGWMWWLER